MSTNGSPSVVRFRVRPGRYAYVRVGARGDAHDVHVSHAERENGTFETIVAPGDRILEIALSSTSDPDLAPARGQLWPDGETRA